MLQKSRNKKQIHNNQLPKVTSSFLLIAIWMSFSFQLFPAVLFGTNSSFNVSAADDGVTISSSQNSYSYGLFYTDTFFEDSEETDNVEESDDERNPDCIISHETSFQSIIADRKFKLVSGSLSCQNKKTVPFYILFHSWKNHLS